VPRPPQPLTFTGALSRRPDDPGPAPDAVRVCGLRIPGRVRADELTVPTGGRLLLTGANGSGKSS
jgi:macrolide transport system ATP-binding/permease protein